MSELSISPELTAADEEQVLSELTGRHELVLSNLSSLREILDKSKSPSGRIYIETLSQVLDIGGFFMDEPRSDPRYRERMFVGVNNGDALTGKGSRLVIRKVGDREIKQIEVDFSDSEEPIIGYFNLEETLFGCRIDSPN